MDTNIDIVSILMPRVQDFRMSAVNFAKSRFLVAASEFSSNEEETAELMSIADSITIDIFAEGSSVGMNIEYGHSPYLGIIQEGMETPLSGGSGGMVTLPDGSTRLSLVPEQLQGQELPEYSKAGQDVMGEVATMMKDLFRQAVEDSVQDSKPEIAEAFKTYLVPHIMGTRAGEF